MPFELVITVELLMELFLEKILRREAPCEEKSDKLDCSGGRGSTLTWVFDFDSKFPRS